MPAYNFKSRFAALVAQGRKRQTIRPVRKTGNPKPGDELQLYMGMRTKHCVLLGKEICKSIEPILIDARGVRINDRPLSQAEVENFARADGFSCAEDFFEFFRQQYKAPFFDGVVIKW